MLKREPIAGAPCDKITSVDIVDLARELGERMKPQTVNNYISHLGAVFTIAGPAWGFPLNKQAMDDAQKVMKRLGLTAKSAERDRRPTLAEIDRLMTYFAERNIRRPASIRWRRSSRSPSSRPAVRKKSTRIAWADLDAEGSRVLVRDMKNPGEKYRQQRLVRPAARSVADH